jgi:DNA-binding MarR family transcriptional regulator
MGEEQLRELGDELMRLGRRRSTVYADAVLETSAFRLLWMLTEGEPRTVRELAEELQLDQSTVTRQVNAAIAHGLVERYAVPGSHSRLLRPTEAGAAAYLHDAGLRAAVFAGAMDVLGPQRSEELVGLLRAFNDAMDDAMDDAVDDAVDDAAREALRPRQD